MTDEQKDLLLEQGAEDGTVILDGFDRAIVGITDDARLVYSYDLMVNQYVEDNECGEEDAIEWIEYNTIRSIPYIGEYRPVIYRPLAI